MSEEILVNVTPMETRVAVVDNGAIQDIHIERSASRGVVGNIYSGKVVRVLPGMQAAFVDIGTERTSFIHVSDILRVDGSGRDDGSRSDNIRDHLHEGKKVVVQVTKDPLGSKGARLTTELSVSSRYLVLMPQNGHIGISQLIEDPAERERLQGLLEQMLVDEQMEQAGGFILRTAAEDAGAEEIRADLRYLKRLPCGTWRGHRWNASGWTVARALPRCRISAGSTCRKYQACWSTIRAIGRCSTCMRSRTKSRKLWGARWNSSQADTWSSTRLRL
jgi:ribonuclease G